MKTLSTLAFSCLALSVSFAADAPAGLTEGKAEFKSMGPITFALDGTLFIADTKSAAIVAVATNDAKASGSAKPVKVEEFDKKVASLLGTAPDQIKINDVAVNPVSHQVYVAVSRGKGPDAVPVLLRSDAEGKLSEVALDKVKHSRAQLPDAPVDGVVGEGRRQSNPRMESITDIAFLEDRVLVAGLSNEEFSSTLRAIPYPFKTVEGGTSVEIYHGAHGKFETKSPVRTFVPFMVGKEPELLAAYTCTPLVRFPINALKPGAKIKGRTIAELGNQNRPLDMIVYKKDGKDFLLLANSSRGVMKISTDGIEAAGVIEEPVRGGGTKGQSYETIKEWTGVEQLDKLDEAHALVLRKGEGSAVTLESLPLP
ncbi:MAG TPA: hypothetical protein VG796_06075 [Verrucomicrobiales bacterium]|nr:hypothetical protein [Verrucomicrobiales bacterium]